MTAIEKIKKVTDWQTCDYVHELTCGNDSNHQLLEALYTGTLGVYLSCPTCGYVQLHIPEIVLQSDISEIIKHNEAFFGKK